MLNNSINYSNLISAGAISNSLNNDNLFVIGVRNQQFGGDYKPVVVEWSTILNEVLSNIQPIPEFDFYNAGDSGTSKTIDWSNGVVQEVNLSNPVAATPVPLSFTNPQLGKTMTLIIKNALGGTRSLTFPSNFYISNNAPFSLVPNPGPGSTISTFNSFPGFNDGALVNTVALRTDNSAVVGGDFTQYNSVNNVNRFMKFNSNTADRDTSFISSGFNGTVAKIVTLPDNSMFIATSASFFNNVTQIPGFIKVSSTGVLDTAFVANTANGTSSIGLNTIAVQPDGKILVGGSFTTISGQSRGRIARYNSDGTLDTTFVTPGSGFNGNCLDIVVQPDGKILTCGSFTSYNSVSVNRIARLNSDGSLDTTFNIGTGPGGFSLSLNTICLQADGKILVGGQFQSWDVISNVGRIARLNPNGSYDNTFTPTSNGFNALVYKIVLDINGKILVGGDFTNTYFTNIARSRFARLNTDGTMDTSFGIGSLFSNTGGDASVRDIAVLPDNTMIIVGKWQTANGSTQRSLTKFTSGIVYYTIIKLDYTGSAYVATL